MDYTLNANDNKSKQSFVFDDQVVNFQVHYNNPDIGLNNQALITQQRNQRVLFAKQFAENGQHKNLVSDFHPPDVQII